MSNFGGFFFRSLVAAIAATVLYPFRVLYRAIERSFFSIKPDARMVLAVGRIDAAAADPARSRSRSFLERALRHVDFSAGHFDPGRTFA